MDIEEKYFEKVKEITNNLENEIAILDPGTTREDHIKYKKAAESLGYKVKYDKSLINSIGEPYILNLEKRV